MLADLYVSKNWPEVLRLLLDPTEPARVRLKAAEMLGDIGEIDVIEPLRSHTFGNEIIDKQAEEANQYNPVTVEYPRLS